ncbi:MAG: ATP-dependent 6-phosphofructokinase [Dehalococcoidales bacterium]|nr:ATP-dependent 6-phosphofructokinase [Dehalococcoidales bacterium]
MKKARIGILPGGGDCAGLNPAIKWVVKTATDERLVWERGISYEVFGIRDGWKGLLDVDPATWDTAGHIVPLNSEIVRTWDRYGGTMLGTSRYSPFDPKHETSKLVMQNIERLGLDALIVIGGDGTLAAATRFAREGINIIGIPKTIDKDLPETDYTLGYETALNVIVEEVDRLRTTAGSHKRIFVVETMGRTAGWLALEGGEACGAYIILIPEYDFSFDRVNELVMEGRRAGTRYEIVIAAEGAKPVGGTEVVRKEGVDSFGRKALGGIGEVVAREIEKGTGLETRSIVLSHLQRGGAPCAYDRRMGRYFGIAAVDLIVRRKFGNMVCLKNGMISCVPLESIYGRISRVDVATQYDPDRYNGRRTILRIEE